MSDDPPRRARAPFDARGFSRLVRRAGAIALEANADTREVASRVQRQIEVWVSREARETHPKLRVETTHSARALSSRSEWVLVVDALDGIDAYLAGLPTWCLSVGLLHRGVPRSAAVYAPALNDLYIANAGHLRWNGSRWDPPSSIEPSRFVLGSGLEKRSILRLRRRREAQGPVAYHACLVARGAADAAVMGRLRLREATAVLPILETAGAGLVSLRSGSPVTTDQLRAERPSRDPLVATRPDLVAGVLERLNR